MWSVMDIVTLCFSFLATSVEILVVSGLFTSTSLHIEGWGDQRRMGSQVWLFCLWRACQESFVALHDACVVWWPKPWFLDCSWLFVFKYEGPKIIVWHISISTEIEMHVLCSTLNFSPHTTIFVNNCLTFHELLGPAHNLFISKLSGIRDILILFPQCLWFSSMLQENFSQHDLWVWSSILSA